MEPCVVLMRHATAQKHGTSDFSRELAPEGHGEAVQQGKLLHALDLGLIQVVASPLVRTEQTGMHVAECLGISCITDPRLAPSQGMAAMLQALRSHVLIVAHQPDVGDLLGYLLTGDVRAVAEFAPGTVAVVGFKGAVRPGGGFLRYLLPPTGAVVQGC